MTKLEIALKKTKSREECEILLNICDDLYNGLPNEKYILEDLPSTNIYNKYANHSKHINVYERQRFNPIVDIHKYIYSDTIQDVEKCLLYPNFDGVNIVIKFVKENDKYIPKYAHTKSKNITDKITEMIKYLKINDKNMFKDISKIILTGVFMCKNRFIFENGKSAIDHYIIALNKINTDMKNFKINLNKFDFIATEINYVIQNNDRKSVDQCQTFLLCSNLECKFNKIKSHKLFNDYYISVSKSTKLNFYKTYLEILENEEYPTNGIIYTSKNYTYKNKFEYDKFIWLPPKHEQIKISSINYNISTYGLNFKIDGIGISKNDPTQTIFDIQLSKIENLIKAGLGIGAICSYDVNKSNVKFISEILIPSEKKYVMPIYCPKCKHYLKYNYEKDILKSINCENPNCDIYSTERWYKFISNMFKCVNDLEIIGARGKKLKRMFPITYLKKMRQPLTREDILNISPNIFEKFERLDFEIQLFVLGYGTKQQIQKMIINKNLRSLLDLQDVWIYNI